MPKLFTKKDMANSDPEWHKRIKGTNVLPPATSGDSKIVIANSALVKQTTKAGMISLLMTLGYFHRAHEYILVAKHELPDGFTRLVYNMKESTYDENKPSDT